MASTKDMIDYFNVPGTYHVSAAAMQLAKRVSDSMAPQGFDGKWVMSFEWLFDRKVKERKDADWIDLGPGLDIGIFHLHEVPQACVVVEDGVAIAAKIPLDILAASKSRLIDVVPADSGQLKLV
jgi:hypothetical protein